MEAADGRAPERRDRPHRHRAVGRESAAPVRRGGLPAARGITRGRASRCARNREQAAAATGRFFSVRQWRCIVDSPLERRVAVGTRMVFRQARRRSKGSRPRLRQQRLRLALARRREELGASPRIAGRRRLPSAVDLAHQLQHHDRRERPGCDHHSQCEGVDPEGDLELVAQSAYRAGECTTSRSTIARPTG